MQIGIDASRANSNERTGIENYSLQIILALARLDRENKYTLYTREQPIEELKKLPANFEIKVLEDKSWWSKVRKIFRLPQFWTHLTLRAELSANSVDLLFVPGHVLPLGYKGKSIVVVHDLGFAIIPEVYSLLQRLYLRWSTKAAIKQASRLVTVSSKTRQDLVDIYKADETRIQVIYPGFDKQIFGKTSRSQIEQVVEEYEICQPYMLFVGNIIPKKGLTDLIKAFGLFAYREYSEVLKKQELANVTDKEEVEQMDEDLAKGEAICLVLAGRGEQDFVEELQNLAEQCLVKDKVKFVGYLEQEKLASLLAGALAYLQPSLYEGFGLPVLEAMASKVPVIVSDSGAMLEVVEDSGRVVKAGDQEAWAEAMQAVATDSKLRKQMREAGYKKIDKFDWDRAAQELTQLFRSLDQTVV